MSTKLFAVSALVLLGSAGLSGGAAWADPKATTPAIGVPGPTGPAATAPKAEDKLVITRGRHVIYDDGRDDLYCRVRGGHVVGYDYYGRPIRTKTRMRCR